MNAIRTIVIELDERLRGEEAVRVAMDSARESAMVTGRSIVDGDADYRVEISLVPNADTSSMRPGTLPTPAEQWYEVNTIGDVSDIVAGGVLGAVYAINWLADRLRVHAALPLESERRAPAFEQRVTFSGLSAYPQDDPPYVNETGMQKALDRLVYEIDMCVQRGATVLICSSTHNIVPYDHPVYGPRSAAVREVMQRAIDAAHARRLRIYTRDDEFLYLPDWFEKTGATFSSGDPAFWEALKWKYRAVFDALPDLDGAATRTGEVLPRGDHLAWNLIHTGEDLSQEFNYRRFIKAMHEVVVGEYGKQYFHRIWAVNTWEQSSVPEIYARTFNEEVPTENMIISIKATTGDQWEWQPLNRTIGESPHSTAVQIETGRAQEYFTGPPDMAVEFAQAGLEWGLEHGSIAATLAIQGPWSKTLFDGMDYVCWRMAWDPYQSVKKVTAEWASAVIGPEVADRVTELVMDLDDIYRDGFHIRGPAYHTWEPLVHVRRGWIAKGNVYVDKGRGHHRFLRDLYIMAKPELELGLTMIHECTERYDRWLASYREWIKDLPDPTDGAWFDEILVRGSIVLHMNRAYVTAFLRFYDWMDNRDEEHREKAVGAFAILEKEHAVFWTYRFDETGVGKFRGYASANTQGIDTFMEYAKPALDDLDGAIAKLMKRPGPGEVAGFLDESQVSDADAVDACQNAVEYLQWLGNIDHREVLHVNVVEGTSSIQHCSGDGPDQRSCMIRENPAGYGRFAVKIHAGGDRGWVYILEQPSKANGNMLNMLMEDHIPGQGAYDIRVYWLPE
jgi:hypothetical protein